MKPKQKQRLVYSGGSPAEDPRQASRSDRRKDGRDKKKKLF
jgi:hypothetical protein